MKLLIDANISWRIVSRLQSDFPGSIHVEDTSLPAPAKDIQIWKFAKDNNYIIITNDDDFLELLTFKGFPPKIVLLRTGNQSTNYITSLLLKLKKDIVNLTSAKDFGVLEIY